MLSKAGIARKSLYLAWDFTVASEQSLTSTILDMRDNALAKLRGLQPRAMARSRGGRQGSSSSRSRPGYRAPPPRRRAARTSTSLDPRVLAHVQGYFVVPCYLNMAGCPPGSSNHYASATSTRPVQIPGNTIQANFQCNIPIGA